MTAPLPSGDRGLLEMAWKAAGYEGKLDFDYAEREGFPQYYFGPRKPMPQGVLMAAMYTYWNPLTDDGDALRLAVKLGLFVCVIHSPGECVEVQGDGVLLVEPLRIDPYAATRRAIVRAAAQIGKVLP